MPSEVTDAALQLFLNIGILAAIIIAIAIAFRRMGKPPKGDDSDEDKPKQD